MYNLQVWSEKLVSYTAHYNDKVNYSRTQELRLLFYQYTNNALITIQNIVDLNHNIVDVISDYPYAVHLDDPYASSIDLNWYTPNRYIFQIGTCVLIAYTDLNLYKGIIKTL